jgi:hypothetical protein
MFGVATMSDISQLRDTLNDLQLKNSDIVLSLNNQFIYVRILSATTEVNVDSITNLSAMVKDNILWSHDKFRQFAKDHMWFNISFHSQNELFTAIRRLEFSSLRLIVQIELFSAMQCTIQGNLL